MSISLENLFLNKLEEFHKKILQSYDASTHFKKGFFQQDLKFLSDLRQRARIDQCIAQNLDNFELEFMNYVCRFFSHVNGYSYDDQRLRQNSGQTVANRPIYNLDFKQAMYLAMKMAKIYVFDQKSKVATLVHSRENYKAIQNLSIPICNVDHVQYKGNAFWEKQNEILLMDGVEFDVKKHVELLKNPKKSLTNMKLEQNKNKNDFLSAYRKHVDGRIDVSINDGWVFVKKPMEKIEVIKTSGLKFS